MLRRALSIRIAPLLLVLAVAACDSHHSGGPGSIGFAPSGPAIIVAGIQPQVIPLTRVFGFGCPLVPPFTSAFDLVVREQTGVDLFLDQVTLQFLDGTNLGGSPIVFQRPELTRIFPSTLIPALRSGVFRFAPQFGCGIGVPQVLIAELFFIDRFEARHRFTIRVPIR